MHLSENLILLQHQLKKKIYKMKGYYHFIIHEPKRREVYATSYIDRVLLRCICDEVLIPALQNRVIYDNAACQKGKGTHFALQRFTKFIQEHYRLYGTSGYVLKCDIRKYFSNIKHSVLKEKLYEVIQDSDIKELLFHYIDSFTTPDTPERGIPLGNQTSQWFGIYYLDSLDRCIKEKLQIKHYIRYMDDLVLIHPSKEYLKGCLIQIRNIVEKELQLELNEKTQIFPLRNGVEFLGWRFYINETGKVIRKLKSQSKMRYKRRMKKLHKEYIEGRIALKDAKAVIASYRGHLRYGHTYQLQEKMILEIDK